MSARWGLVIAMAVAGVIGAGRQAAAATASEGPDPFAHGSIEAGAAKAAACGACHGPSGNSSNAQWPNLAGQNAVYIAEQLQLFKAGVRVDSNMLKMTAPLSEADIDNIAVYFQAQTPHGGEADPGNWQQGEKLFRFGDPARAIPACTACHGPLGRGNMLADYPALRAQHAEYVAKQLTDFASGARYAGAKPGAPTSRNGVIMTTIAKLLTPQDIRDVASYIQGMR
ncbi:MAG TPA: c-type cytochrome [Steroidobacteraceae bacterium]|nr:c-type cytochrome [Steroidobacteraceae bacterium]